VAHVIEGLLDLFTSASFWAASVRIATPLMFGVLGALLCERAGVLNLGIEGIFTAGALSGWLAVWLGAPLWGGIAVAAGVGAAFGALHATLTVPLALSQHVSGLAVTLLASSLSYFSYRVALPNVSSPPRIVPFQPVLFGQTALTYLALALFGVVAFLLHRTPLGLAVRAVGENPAAAEAQGLDVHRIRFGAVVAGSALMGVGGAFLTMAAFNAFFFEMTAGRGWICIALVVFASWRPGKALLGTLLFGAFDAFQVRLQVLSGGAVPGQVFLMLPYLLSILALVLVARRAEYPQALMIPYVKGTR